MAELVPLVDGVSAWLADGPGHGRTNAVVVVDDDGLTVVDALVSPATAAPLAAALAELGAPIRRLVLTSSHLEYVGGSTAFPLAAVYGTPQVSAHLDQPPNLAALRALFPQVADELDEELRTRPVSHVVDAPAWLTPTACAVPTTGQLAENLVVAVPGASIVAAGAVASFGVTPCCFDGDPAAWADALDGVLELGVIVVPGQGPIGGEEEVRDLQAYLRAVVAADGDPAALPPGPWDAWTDRRWDEVNVERAALLARGDHRPPPSMLRAAGLG